MGMTTERFLSQTTAIISQLLTPSNSLQIKPIMNDVYCRYMGNNADMTGFRHEGYASQSQPNHQGWVSTGGVGSAFPTGMQSTTSTGTGCGGVDLRSNCATNFEICARIKKISENFPPQFHNWRFLPWTPNPRFQVVVAISRATCLWIRRRRMPERLRVRAAICSLTMPAAIWVISERIPPNWL